jgi:ankyrin repeat protein
MKYAAMAGKDDVVDVMVDHGAPMEIQVAALLGRVSLVASMLEADPSLLDEGLLLAAVIRDQVEVVEFLLDRAKEGAGQPSIGVNTGLHAAIHHKHRALKTLKLLLARGADANFKNEWGGLPLQAFSTGSDLGGLRKEMCDLLIAHGANPEDQSNPTP